MTDAVLASPPQPPRAAVIERVAVEAYRIPTDAPESDGTLEWDHTTIVVVRVSAAGVEGLGYSYADEAAATLVAGKLAPVVEGRDALSVGGAWMAMNRAVRNLGRPGLAAAAISAVDIALWDLKARLFGVALATLLDPVRQSVPLYGSGGFTSYPVARLQEQLAGWAEQGFARVKMKVGRQPDEDPARIRAARDAIGPRVELFIDANGACSRKQALALAQEAARCGVRWFEEPVSSDDLEGLRLVRDRGPAGMAIAAGEYGYHLPYFEQMLAAGAVDVLQADATRCGGISGFLAVAPLVEARSMLLSAHTAPNVHAHACCAVRALAHLEYFHDHARIEPMLFDGALQPVEGVLVPDTSRPGLGLTVKEQDAARYRL